MIPPLKPVVESFITEHKLPASYTEAVEHCFLPMIDKVLQKVATHQGTYVIGVSGCQGSGKSTLAEFLVLVIRRMTGLRCINLSIDDFYLTHAERRKLAKNVHPLLATRGVPGTHDITLALDTISALKKSGQVAVPRFDKSVDDRFPKRQWPKVWAPVDIIVLEGWCLSVDAQSDAMLAEPINALEEREDPEGIWRQYVNDAIRSEYGTLFDLVDYLVMLKAPDFNKVYDWRQNQESRLREQVAATGQQPAKESRIMSPEELSRFIQHYERVTRHALDTLPDKADAVFQLTDQQTITNRLG